MIDEERRAEVAERAARAGAEVAAAAFRTGIDIEEKEGKTDYVTQADRDAQVAVVDVLADAVPDEPVVGEEEETLYDVPDDGPAWIVDPIDGTNNFVRDIPLWGTSVAAVIDGDPVAGATAMPALGDVYVAGPDVTRRNGEVVTTSERTDPETFTVVPTFWWDFDQREEYARACRALVTRFGDIRRLGSAQATLALLADGGVEGVVTNRRTNSWDTLAGVRMVRSAGGVVTNLEGDRWEHDDAGLVASNGGCHDVLLEAAREI